ncbi:nucleoside triphosphate pyrophosphohydrolase [Coleofasciculus sp. FACHB-501]|uniref:nucleoside triphosphate pyrophosphohydrolase n=1 Tax=Cyanophyceae TaxID=3028117 RepID=UPI0016868DD2|nr:nucleoside triphosphate pyrophosphohydrolase [Coleofasciculus sp. FACHB-501]MBD1836644.1 nucleoside triphosphate pyrophosphohydrolase [Coleofasciculus sp. FACHB-501]
MRQDYNKLVRDRIPEIIEKSGYQYEVTTLSESEYRKALCQKLVEEAQEAATAEPEELIKEIADLYEVVEAILVAYKIDKKSVLKLQEERRQSRGRFERRIKLLWTMKR